MNLFEIKLVTLKVVEIPKEIDFYQKSVDPTVLTHGTPPLIEKGQFCEEKVSKNHQKRSVL